MIAPLYIENITLSNFIHGEINLHTKLYIYMYIYIYIYILLEVLRHRLVLFLNISNNYTKLYGL